MSIQPTQLDRNYATFWQRWLAVVCDQMILGIMPLLGIYYLLNSVDPTDLVYRIVIYFFLISIPSLVFSFFYHSWFISNIGATLGKQIWGIEVVDEEEAHLSFWMAFFREFVAKQVSHFTFCLGFLWMIKDKNKQTWHDMLSGTYLIKKESSWNSWLATLMITIAVILLIVAIVAKINEFSQIFSVLLEG